MSKRKTLGAGATMLGLLVGLGSTAATAQTTTTQGTSSAQTSTSMQGGMDQGAGKGAVNSADMKFMMMAAQGGMAEVEMGQVALKQASSDSVKQYAQKMIDDHTKANDELKGIATPKGVSLPTEPSAKHKAAMSKLSSLSGEAFDREYIKQAGNKDHADQEKLFQREATRGTDAEVKAFAAKTLPVVQEHLQMARGMSKMGGSKQSSSMSNSGGSTMGGSSTTTGGSSTTGSGSSTGSGTPTGGGSSTTGGGTTTPRQ